MYCVLHHVFIYIELLCFLLFQQRLLTPTILGQSMKSHLPHKYGLQKWKPQSTFTCGKTAHRCACFERPLYRTVACIEEFTICVHVPDIKHNRQSFCSSGQYQLYIYKYIRHVPILHVHLKLTLGSVIV